MTFSSLGMPGSKRLCPAPTSLIGLIHGHKGAPLFVPPSKWTDFHARALGVDFEELARCDEPTPRTDTRGPPSKGHSRPSEAITSLAYCLDKILEPKTDSGETSRVINTVLSKFWPDQFSKPAFCHELPLRFGKGVYRGAVNPEILWNDSAGLPMVCYISKKQLTTMREPATLFKRIPPPGSKYTTDPVIRLLRARSRALSKALIPKETAHDVQFAAIFLAMAQHHFYADPHFHSTPARGEGNWLPSAGAPQRPDFQDINLRILTVDIGEQDFIVYTGRVTAKVLDSFHDPLTVPPREDENEGIPGITIYYTRVRIWPILGLLERIGRALGEDIVGSVDDAKLKTWLDDNKPQNASKRGREAVDVFNGNLGEESYTNGKPIAIKKPRLDNSPVSRCGTV